MNDTVPTWIPADDNNPLILTVVYSSDDKYAMLAGISAESLLDTNRSAKSIEIVILDNDISDENRQKLLRTVVKYGRQIRFIDIARRLDEIRSLKADRYTSFSAYARLYIAELLADNNGKILYIDCDTLVCGDIQELMASDMNDKPVAMALDCVRNEYKRVVGISPESYYYNSGVMLIDLSVWRSWRCTTLILEHMKTVRASYPLIDQDLLNVVLHDQIVRIDSKFNLLSQLHLYNYAGTLIVYGLKAKYWISQEEFENARSHTVIHHFSGNTFVRPWFENTCHPIAAEYRNRLISSEWKNVNLSTLKTPLPYRIQLFGFRHLPRQLFVWLSLLMQRMFIRISYNI